MSKSAEYQAKWRAKNPEYAKNYYQRNKEKLLQKQKEYYERVKLLRKANVQKD
jgi:hypothetical protein